MPIDSKSSVLSTGPNQEMPRVFDDIYQRPEEVRFWLGQGPGKAFLRTLREWKLEYEGTLRKSENVVKMHRAQGALEILDRILNLKEELNNVVGQKR